MTADRAETILIADDDAALRETLVATLKSRGYAVVHASSSKQLFSALKRNPSLIVLSLHLGGEDGLALSRSLRERTTVPIIMLVEPEDATARPFGLHLAAEESLCKPFEAEDLVKHVRKLLARSGAAAERLRFGDWVLDRELQSLRRRSSGREIQLTTGEYRVLEAFALSPRQVLSRDRLLRALRDDVDSFDRAVDMLILRLRRKLENNPYQPRLIQTARDSGYLFSSPVQRS